MELFAKIVNAIKRELKAVFGKFLYWVRGYLEFCQTSKMVLLINAVHDFMPLTTFARNTILEVWLNFKYASDPMKKLTELLNISFFFSSFSLIQILFCYLIIHKFKCYFVIQILANLFNEISPKIKRSSFSIIKSYGRKALDKSVLTDWNMSRHMHINVQ